MEKFRAIPNWPDHFATKEGEIWSCKFGRWKLLKPGAMHGRSVAVWMLLTFVGPRPKGMQACHNDGNSANNQLENLRWDTPKRNALDRAQHGHSRRQLTCDQVIEIRNMVKGGEFQTVVARRYGVNLGVVSQIVRNITYKECSDEAIPHGTLSGT